MQSFSSTTLQRLNVHVAFTALEKTKKRQVLIVNSPRPQRKQAPFRPIQTLDGCARSPTVSQTIRPIRDARPQSNSIAGIGENRRVPVRVARSKYKTRCAVMPGSCAKTHGNAAQVPPEHAAGKKEREPLRAILKSGSRVNPRTLTNHR